MRTPKTAKLAFQTARWYYSRSFTYFPSHCVLLLFVLFPFWFGLCQVYYCCLCVVLYLGLDHHHNFCWSLCHSSVSFRSIIEQFFCMSIYHMFCIQIFWIRFEPIEAEEWNSIALTGTDRKNTHTHTQKRARAYLKGRGCSNPTQQGRNNSPSRWKDCGKSWIIGTNEWKTREQMTMKIYSLSCFTCWMQNAMERIELRSVMQANVGRVGIYMNENQPWIF